MKFLCLAYGAEKDWLELTPPEQKKLLAQDEVIRNGSNFMSAVETAAITVTAWDGALSVVSGSFAKSRVPLAGFSIIEAADFNEVARLVSGTPCARAKGAIEIRPLLQSDGK